MLAKVLAARLRRALAHVIDFVQTAFLTGCRIGENFFLLQSLPAWLLW